MRRRNPKVLMSANARISACGKTVCIRAAAANSVRPLVITSSTRTILQTIPGGGTTRKDSKCSDTVGRARLGAVADLRTAARRRNPIHTVCARPTSRSATASVDAAQGASSLGALPGTGTRTAPPLNSARRRGSPMAARYTTPAYRASHIGLLSLTLSHSRREACATAPSPCGE